MTIEHSAKAFSSSGAPCCVPDVDLILGPGQIASARAQRQHAIRRYKPGIEPACRFLMRWAGRGVPSSPVTILSSVGHSPEIATTSDRGKDVGL